MPQDDENGDENENEDEAQPVTEGLKNREAGKEKDGMQNAKISGAQSRDPIRWFGLLPSQALRTSQAHFKSGIAYA